MVLLVEGETELALQELLKRWLDPRTPKRVGIKVKPLGGAGSFLRDVGAKTRLHLQNSDTLAVIGLMDLHGFPVALSPGDRREQVEEARSIVVDRIPSECRPRFRQHFAVHELEAWMFSDPSILPFALPSRYVAALPEDLDLGDPPSRHLHRLYKAHRPRGYVKTLDGKALLGKLDPSRIYEKCPHFAQLLDELLALAS
ncbi:MAG: DUF4276 family protein [Chloroflexi bacterium]|nr:DUF4276 family protein [Chloroflexota bacterium]